MPPSPPSALVKEPPSTARYRVKQDQPSPPLRHMEVEPRGAGIPPTQPWHPNRVSREGRTGVAAATKHGKAVKEDVEREQGEAGGPNVLLTCMGHMPEAILLQYTLNRYYSKQRIH